MNGFRFSIAFQKLDGANQHKSNARHSRRQELNTKILMLWYTLWCLNEDVLLWNKGFTDYSKQIYLHF